LFMVYAFVLDTHPTPLIVWHVTSNTCPTCYFNPVTVLHPIHDRLFCIFSSHGPEATLFSSSTRCVKIIPSLVQLFTQLVHTAVIITECHQITLFSFSVLQT
jgi:hypothetical protein